MTQKTLRRLGAWALEKREEGLYAITLDGDTQAEIVTHAHEPTDPLVDYDPLATTYQVRDTREAEQVFVNYVEKQTGYIG